VELSVTGKRTDTARGRRDHDGLSLPTDLDDLTVDEVLYDRRCKDYYLVTEVDERGIALLQRDTEFYLPHSLFVPWYGSRLFSIEHTTSLEVPKWCR
jgi:hypothetical protein